MYNKPYHNNFDLSKYNFLVTGGAGFIGSNLVEYLLKYNAKKVRVIDNFSTGKRDNIRDFINRENFELVEADIRSFNSCAKAANGMDFVFHEAALGSVPRSILDPITTNDVNINGFLNMLVASRDAGVKRFIYAASSSTYGDSKELPKVEDNIGKPLSPYAVTKYVNELYADVFSKLYGLNLIGLRYFNVFGQRQDPNGAYAAVIPKFINQLLNHESPVINGDGEHSRDFTYIENVVQMNMKALIVEDKEAFNQVFNVAFGEKTTLNEVVTALKENLKQFDSEIELIKPIYGENRRGDVMHSLASIEKAKKLVNYNPEFSFSAGLKDVIEWYVSNKNLVE